MSLSYCFNKERGTGEAIGQDMSGNSRSLKTSCRIAEAFSQVLFMLTTPAVGSCTNLNILSVCT